MVRQNVLVLYLVEKRFYFHQLTECSYKETPTLKTESDLRACAKHLEDETTQMQAMSMVYLFKTCKCIGCRLRYST